MYTQRGERALTLKARACVHTCGTVSNRIERSGRTKGVGEKIKSRGGPGSSSFPAPLGGNEISPSHLAASLRNVIGPDSGALASRWDAPTYTPSGPATTPTTTTPNSFSLSLLAFPIFSSFPFQPPAALSSPLFLITKLITLSRSSSQRKNGRENENKNEIKNDDDDVRHFQMTPSANLLQVLSPIFFIYF